ncbi:hypothetical protein [Mycobacterium spongiae]|uniref:hypothetical protein n=1 Tax=Mycobacterium spongiae TaxID=886343 RepID=UPI003CCED8B5
MLGHNAPTIAAAEGNYQEISAADAATIAGHHSAPRQQASALPHWPAGVARTVGCGPRDR